MTSTTVTSSSGYVYLLSSDVVVYQKTATYQYLKIPLNDILDNEQYKVTAYYDKSQVGGGRIRVLIAESK